MQTAYDMDGRAFSAAKQELHNRLRKLADELDHYQAGEYGIALDRTPAYEQWRQSHQPLHWFAEFYGIVGRGGFDVVIGNPPYIELSKLRSDYRVCGFLTEPTGNLYCLMIERGLELLSKRGRLGMIVPLSLSCTERMSEMRGVLESRAGSLWISHFSGDANPSKLFEGVKFRLNIVLADRRSPGKIFSSSYLKWFADERNTLFYRITYSPVDDAIRHLRLIPKLGHRVPNNILRKLLRNSHLECWLGENSKYIYIHRVITMFVKCFDFIPYFWNEIDGEKKSDDYKPYKFTCDRYADEALAFINSSTFFLFCNIW
jgi:Eco57I restriction-modification methylase